MRLMAVALHAAPDHCAVEHIERGKQRCRAMPFVVVGHRAAAAGLQRQPRLGAGRASRGHALHVFAAGCDPT